MKHRLKNFALAVITASLFSATGTLHRWYSIPFYLAGFLMMDWYADSKNEQ